MRLNLSAPAAVIPMVAFFSVFLSSASIVFLLLLSFAFALFYFLFFILFI